MGADHGRRLRQADHAVEQGRVRRANNTQDDFAVMQSNGAPLRTDDHLNSLAQATSLGSGTPLSTSGVVGTRTDVDWFSFRGSGPTSVNVTPAPASPNLDVRVELYDAAGVLVASADPSSLTFSIRTSQEGSLRPLLAAAVRRHVLRESGWRRVRQSADQRVLGLRERRSVHGLRHDRSAGTRCSIERLRYRRERVGPRQLDGTRLGRRESNHQLRRDAVHRRRGSAGDDRR